MGCSNVSEIEYRHVFRPSVIFQEVKETTEREAKGIEVKAEEGEEKPSTSLSGTPKKKSPPSKWENIMKLVSSWRLYVCVCVLLDIYVSVYTHTSKYIDR